MPIKSILEMGAKPLKWKPKEGLVNLSKDREKLFESLSKIPGNTSLEIADWLSNANKLFIKNEFENKPTGSHYDRVYSKLLHSLERIGITPKDFILVETSSGNATPAFGYFARQLGYETIAFLPAEIGENRKNLSREQCDKVIIANPEKHGWGVYGASNAMKEALAKNREVRKSDPGKKMLYCVNHSQVSETLEIIKNVAEEIVKQLSGETPDYFLGVAGNGTILYGVGRELKKHFPKIKIISVESFERPVFYLMKYPGRYEKQYNCQPPSMEEMVGKDFFAPGTGALGVDFPNLHSALEICDDALLIKRDETKAGLKKLEDKGYAVGHTSAMSYVAAKKLAKSQKNKSILIIFYDLISRY